MPDETAVAEKSAEKSKKSFGVVRGDFSKWLGKAGPCLLLAGATLFFVLCYIPKFYFSAIDTETVFLPLFYHDIVVLHHSPANWGWGGVSALFPDVTFLFLLNYLVKDGQLALQLLIMCFFVGWLAASIALAFVLQRRAKLSLCALLLFFWVAAMCNYGLPPDWGPYLQKPLFEPVWHGGGSMLCLICLVLMLRQVAGSRLISFNFMALLVLIFLGGVSDALFYIVFALPALGTLAVLAVFSPRRWRDWLGLALGIILTCGASHFLGPYLFAVHMATDSYVQIGYDRTHDSYTLIVNDLSQPTHHFYLFLVILDGLTVLAGFIALPFLCFSAWKKRTSPLVLILVAFCPAAICCNWLGVLLTGDYHGITETRYLSVALNTPLLLLLFGFHGIVLWRPWLENLFAVAIAGFTIAVTFTRPDPSINYICAEEDIPDLKAIMKEHDIHYCLANYWNANITAFLSHGDVPTRSLTNDGKIYEMVNSLEWFGKGHPFEEIPHFRMIYIPDHNYSDVFGRPDQIIYTSHHSEVWLYSDQRSIRYSEYFGVLSNKFLEDGRTLRIDASTLPGETGVGDGHAKVAAEGKQSAGWLAYGPYLHLAPARYRATYHYTYLAPPHPDQLASYDLRAHTGDFEESSHFNTLPCPDTGPHDFTDDFTVARPGQNFEMRVFYHGTGTLRLDSLDVTYLSH